MAAACPKRTAWLSQCIEIVCQRIPTQVGCVWQAFFIYRLDNDRNLSGFAHLPQHFSSSGADGQHTQIARFDRGVKREIEISAQQRTANAGERVAAGLGRCLECSCDHEWPQITGFADRLYHQ